MSISSEIDILKSLYEDQVRYTKEFIDSGFDFFKRSTVTVLTLLFFIPVRIYYYYRRNNHE
jgi:hypothetical protein